MHHRDAFVLEQGGDEVFVVLDPAAAGGGLPIAPAQLG